MISYPNAKINLGLNVVGRRDDGYHDIETVFYPVPHCDILEILPAGSGLPEFTLTGIGIPGPSQENLCMKAVRLFHSSFLPADVPVPALYLHKRIPSGSGLGGGSSDAAFTLKMLNDLHGLSLGTERLEELALKLGSDCPFFIRNRPVLARGRGDLFSDVDISLRGYFLVLAIPPVSVNTAEAYAMVKPSPPKMPLEEIVRLPVQEWNGKLFNDFEAPVFERFPVIRELRDTLLQSGALYASMSGSGSAVYGIFRDPPTLNMSSSVLLTSLSSLLT